MGSFTNYYKLALCKTAKYKNLFSPTDKLPWVNAVWEIIQKSYERIGGIKGSGFRNPQDMVKNIPFWKLYVSYGEVAAVILYKDRNGRKLVAIGTNGSIEGKQGLAKMLKVDFSRAYSELSGPLLRFTQKLMSSTELDKYRIPFSQVIELMSAKWDAGEIRQIDEYRYERYIGGQWYEKQMFGTPKLTIRR